MDFKSLTLLYFVFIGQSIKVRPFLYQCTFDKHLVTIELKCPGDTKIHIVDIWIMDSANIYECRNYEATLTEQKHGLTTEMRHTILTECFYQRHCQTGIFPDLFLSDGRSSSKKRGIGISYECIPVVKFMPICNITPEKTLSEIYLIDRTDDNIYQDTCRCIVTYRGNNGQYSLTLTHFPTYSAHLEIKTRQRHGSREKSYDDKVYTNKTVYISPYTAIQELILTKNATSRNRKMELLVVRIAANDEHNTFTLQCVGSPAAPTYGPYEISSVALTYEPHETSSAALTYTSSTIETAHQEVSSTTTYVVTSAVIAVCLLDVGVCAFVIYRRIKRKKIVSSSHVDTMPPGMVSSIPRNVSSIYVDCNKRLAHSYAEIGSISDYRHYVMPDDVSQKSLKVKIRYKTLVENNCSDEDIAGYVGSTSPGVILGKKRSRKKKDRKGNGAENSSTVGDSDKTDSTAQNSKAISGDQIKEECMANVIDMIPNEHYDPSGYLDLDIPEQASNLSLTNWKKEIYSVEHMAKAERTTSFYKTGDLNEIGHGKVKICHKDMHDEHLGNRYDYVSDRKIIFSEYEPVNKHADTRDNGATSKDASNSAEKEKYEERIKY